MKDRKGREPVGRGASDGSPAEKPRHGSEELPNLLTPDEACQALRVGRTKLYEELRHGSLQGVAFRWGRRYLIPKEALRQLMEGSDHDSS